MLYGLSQIWFGRQPPSWSNLVPLLISLAAAIALAAALYRFVEHPAEKGLRSMLTRPSARTVPTAPPRDEQAS